MVTDPALPEPGSRPAAVLGHVQTRGGGPRWRRSLRRVAFNPTVNHTARAVIRAVSRIAPDLAQDLDAHLPFAGRCPVVLPGGESFFVIADQSSHSSTSQLCRDGFSGLEQDVADIFLALAVRAGTVLDVGANIGGFAMAAATVAPHAEVIAFEPFPAVFERLLANCVLNDLQNVICVQAAAGRATGSQRLIAPAGLPTTASVEAGHRLRHPWVREPGPYTFQIVPVVDVDSFADNVGLSGVDLVKIDAEQAEVDIIAGMQRTIGSHRPHIICEIFPGTWTKRDAGAEIEEILGPLGYSYYLLADGVPLATDRIEGDKEHFNYLFSMLKPGELSALL
jgi:FkbM family methyltransferase